MRIDKLQIRQLRNLAEVMLDLGPGLNLFTGANGAGKTSVLEAVFLLSHGRSFRSGARDALTQRGANALAIHAQVRRGPDAPVERFGLGRQAGRWRARREGASIALGALVQGCAVVCFEPGSHALIGGAAEERRHFLDWGVFHVEPSFWAAWQRYQRALKQRNALLRSDTADERLFAPWEQELSSSATAMDHVRSAYLGRLQPLVAAAAASLLPELGAVSIGYQRGWPAEADSLADWLAGRRPRDQARGHTTAGAHRADWSLSFEHAPLREHLSRGQEKLAALACLLAQAQLFADDTGNWPIVCLDDLASELDHAHQASLVAWVAHRHAQVLITGTEAPAALAQYSARMFHVEQGHVRALV